MDVNKERDNIINGYNGICSQRIETSRTDRVSHSKG